MVHLPPFVSPEGSVPVLNIQRFDAAVFDLDGIVTRTAAVHAAAWKQLFDDYLAQRPPTPAEDRQPFDVASDYRRYVDGKPRYKGVQSFLESRGIRLPYGAPDDPPERETICGLGNRKNALFQELVRERGVEVFESSVAFIRKLRQHGLRTALVSSSKNARQILDRAGLSALFDACVDGVDAARLGLSGKPDPDIFVRAAEALGVTPSRAFAVEDALSGIEAARAARFGLVIAIDRTGAAAAALEAHGADIVVTDLSELDVSFDADPKSATS